MVFQNLLRTGDRILECGVEPPPPGFIQEEHRHPDPGADTGPGSTTAGPGPGPGGGKDLNPHRVLSVEENLHPVLRPSVGSEGPQTPQQVDSALEPGSGSVLCHRHRLAQWPPGLLDQALRLGLLEARKDQDPVLVLARRLGKLGERRGEGGGGDLVLPLPRCSCHGVLGSGPGGEDPGDTSDALLVLEGLGSEEVGGAASEGAGPVFSGGTLSGLMRQVHRLAEEAGVLGPCADPQAPVGPLLRSHPPHTTGPGPDPGPRPQHQHQSRSQPQSRAATPKLGTVGVGGGAGRSASPLVVLEGEAGRGRDGEKTPRGKSRKGGSLKVRLSKLFRTKSSSGGSGGLLDKRPSLASSTSSGGSLLDVWGSTCSSTEQDGTSVLCPSLTLLFCLLTHLSVCPSGETVSLVDVDISRRGGSSLHPPTPPPPPRRSLSLLDDFGGPPQQQPPFSGGASMQSLPPRPLTLTPSISNIQHSLSLNDTFLRGLPRPVPLRPDGQHAPPRLASRCPLSRPDASSFATSLRELEKCGWYWGPMNWEDAEMKLKAKPDGSFLVRDSSDPRYILSLSFRSQGVTHHTRMEHYRGTFSLWCHPKFEDRCHSVVEFIERAIMHSKNGKFLYFLRSRVPGLPPTPVQLLYPVSRFSSVKSLQHLCRFCIRQLVRIDHIQELPLPTPLISYLRKFYYYDPEEEIHPALKDRGLDQSGQMGVESQT
uniref:Suppressor of cytokine signaling 7 n=1 Tax=Sphaeramia orbicularis TaxID=375764 RepID=A0A673AZF6_9TELE